MTCFLRKRSAKYPIRRRPPTLDQRIRNCAVSHTESAIDPFWKPSSRKTNFMWKLTAPMEPMEQKLPMRSSQKDQLAKSWRKVSEWMGKLGGGFRASTG